MLILTTDAQCSRKENHCCSTICSADALPCFVLEDVCTVPHVITCYSYPIYNIDLLQLESCRIMENRLIFICEMNIAPHDILDSHRSQYSLTQLLPFLESALEMMRSLEFGQTNN